MNISTGGIKKHLQKRKWLKYGIIAFVALALLASLFVFKNDFLPGDDEKEYRISSEMLFSMGRIKTLNPAASEDEDTYYITKLIYEGLFELDNTMTPELLLAESYEFNKGKGSVDIKLKSGVKWHDGKDFTADDVRFTITALKAAGTKCLYAEQVSNISGTSVKDDDEIVIYFNDENNVSLDQLTFPVLPEHRYSDIYYSKTPEDDFRPVGTGPYEYKKFSEAAYLELGAYQDYHGQKAQNSIKFIVLSNRDNANRLVESSNISVLFSKEAGRAAKISKKNMDTVDFPANEVEYIGYNMESPGTSKKSVRKAIAYAIDTKTIIEECYYNSGLQNDNLYFPGYLGIKSEKDAYTYSTGKAAALLKRAGYKDRDNDGYLESTDGTRLTINIAVDSGNASRISAAEYIKDFLDNLRIDTYIIEGDWNAYLARLNSKNYDIFIGGLKYTESMDMRVILSGEGQSNYTGYKNGKMDDMLDEMRSGITIEEMRSLYGEIKELSKEELPYYCLLYKTYGAIKAPALQGEVTPLFFDLYYGCENWKCRYELTEEKSGEQ